MLPHQRFHNRIIKFTEAIDFGQELIQAAETAPERYWLRSRVSDCAGGNTLLQPNDRSCYEIDCKYYPALATYEPRLLDAYEKTMLEYLNLIGESPSPEYRYERRLLVRYSPTQEFRAHVDVKEVGPWWRRFAIITYLNKPESGGQLWFPHLDLRVEIEANSVVIYPITQQYAHEACRVIKGTKYCVVCWYQFRPTVVRTVRSNCNESY